MHWYRLALNRHTDPVAACCGTDFLELVCTDENAEATLEERPFQAASKWTEECALQGLWSLSRAPS